MMPLASAAVDRRPRRALRVTASIHVATLLAMMCMTGCSDPKPEPHTKMLVVGIDGMEWSVVLPLLREGKLPNIQKLMDRGSYGRLGTFNPTLSPIIWTTIATGKTQEQHGVLGFDYIDEATGQQRLYTSLHRKTKAVWDILSEKELMVDVFGWWITWPAEPVSGKMVSQFSGLDQAAKVWKGTVQADGPAQTHPRGYFETVRPLVLDIERDFAAPDESSFAGRVHELFGPLKSELTELEKRLLDDSIWSFKADELYARITEQALTQDDADLTLCYFGGTDVVGHRFFKYYEPRHYRFPPSPEALAAFQRIIPDYYCYIDSVLGRLMAKCGDDTAILIVADHGMIPVNTELDHEKQYALDKGLGAINSGHHPNAESGVIIAAGGPFKKMGYRQNLRARELRVMGTVYQVTPTILHLMGLPIGEDMFQNGVLDSLLQGNFLQDHRPAFLPTYDTEPERWFAIRQERGFDGVDEEKLEQLKRLGYVGDDKPEKPEKKDDKGEPK